MNSPITLLAKLALVSAPVLLASSLLAQVPAEKYAYVLNPNAKVIETARFEYADLDSILLANVVNGKVDYVNIRKNWWPQLEAYLARVSTFDADTLPPKEKLALYINLYNAQMIHTIIERYRADYTCAEDNKKIFNEPLVRVGNKTISLNYLEHKLIRGTFQDSRIHGALICGGLGCPPIANFAFRGDILDEQLDARMVAWAADNTRNIVDEAAKTVTLSKLFKSYAADFGGEDKAIAAVAKYRGLDFSTYKVSFDTNYDWSLNSLPPRYGRWVSLIKDSETAKAGTVYEVTGEVDGKLVVEALGVSNSEQLDPELLQPYPAPTTPSATTK